MRNIKKLDKDYSVEVDKINKNDWNNELTKFEDATFAGAPPGPFKEFGQNRWVFYTKPIIGGFFIQDKFEHESLIINALRIMEIV